MTLFPKAKKFQEIFYPKISDYECKDELSLALDADHAFEG